MLQDPGIEGQAKEEAGSYLLQWKTCGSTTTAWTVPARTRYDWNQTAVCTDIGSSPSGARGKRPWGGSYGRLA